MDLQILKPTSLVKEAQKYEQLSFKRAKMETRIFFNNSYSICFFKNKFSDTTLSVVNLILPEDTKTFNTGSSLKRWSNKRPRLKSSCSSSSKSDDNKRHEPPTHEESYETNPDVPALQDEFIADVYGEVDFTTNEESSRCNYGYEEVLDPDIERLLLLEEQRLMRHGGETAEKEAHEEKDEKNERNKQKGGHNKKRNGDADDNDANREKKKKKKQKTIKFSLSKPPSPATEQIIRVDVTSNYSLEETDYDEINDANGDDCSREHAKKILRDRINSKRIIQHRQHEIQSHSKSFDDGVDDFVVQCRKLALNDRKP